MCLEQPAGSSGSQKATTAIIYAETHVNPGDGVAERQLNLLAHFPPSVGARQSSCLATGFPVFGCRQ